MTAKNQRRDSERSTIFAWERSNWRGQSPGSQREGTGGRKDVLVAQTHRGMSEIRWWLALVFGGFGVPMLVYIWNRLGRVRFDPSDWRMGFWESTMPGLQFVGDDNRASPDRASIME